MARPIGYNLLMQPSYIRTQNAQDVKGLWEDFGCVVTETPFTYPEMKEIPSNDWAEEDGEDVYIPSVLTLKSLELSFSVAYASIRDRDVRPFGEVLDRLVSYFRGDGQGAASFVLYSPYAMRGWDGCVFSGISDVSVSRELRGRVRDMLDFYGSEKRGLFTYMGADDIMEFKLKFKCYTPSVEVIPMFNLDDRTDDNVIGFNR